MRQLNTNLWLRWELFLHFRIEEQEKLFCYLSGISILKSDFPFLLFQRQTLKQQIAFIQRKLLFQQIFTISAISFSSLKALKIFFYAFINFTEQPATKPKRGEKIIFELFSILSGGGVWEQSGAKKKLFELYFQNSELARLELWKAKLSILSFECTKTN